MLLHKVFNLRVACVRGAFRRRDTPFPAPDLDSKVLRVRTQYMERETFPGEFAAGVLTGKIYDKKPLRIRLDVDRQYKWCTCGQSKGQPFCDGTHARLDGTDFVKTRPLHRPLAFQVPASDEYYLCNCKRTSNPPYCDGTHKRQDIQDAVRS